MKKIISIILLTIVFGSIAYAGAVEVKLTEEDIVDNTEKTVKKLDEVMPLSEELFEWSTGNSEEEYSYTADDKESVLFILLEKQELTLYPVTAEGINKNRVVKLILTDNEQVKEQEKQEPIEARQEEKKEEVKNDESKVTESESGNSDKDVKSKADSDADGDLAGNADDSSQSEQSNRNNSQVKNEKNNTTDEKVVVANSDNNMSESNNDNNTNKNIEKNTDSNVKDTSKDTIQNSQTDTAEEGKKSNMIWIIILLVLLAGVVGVVLSKKKEK